MKCRIKAQSAQVLDIEVFDVIGENMSWSPVTFKDVARQIKAFQGDTIQVSINSAGGEVFEGLAIYNLLRGSGKAVKTTCVGLAASMASILFMAGDTREICDNAFLMIHNPSAVAQGESDDLRQVADAMDKVRDCLIDIYTRSGQDPKVIKKAMDAETYYDAEECVALGYATAIKSNVKMAAKADLSKLPNNIRAKLGKKNMDPQLLEQLGLPATATLEDVMSAIKALQQASKGGDSVAALAGVVAGLSAKIDSVVTGVQGLKTTAQASEKATILASIANRVTPTQEKWLANQSIETIRGFIATLPASPIVAEEAQREVKAKESELTAEEKEICRVTGVSEKSLLDHKKGLVANG